MSSNFWLELGLALALLAGGITLVHQYKFGAIRRLRAKWLRNAMLPTLKQLLNELATQSYSDASEGYRLLRLRADLEEDYQRASVLFDEERVVLAEFLSGMSNLVARADSGLATSRDLDAVLLVGQRALLEISEINS
ncbi:hypothetical protein [Arenicella xantha]|uniref:Uncharacterized protein n=1 Tax=Arenicella xantha TaxID=644221 RepID=A0A395JHX6_9GAMM|nr:hypothetical protein [Arenicella xantha]RBP47115.1 hypothetical protein DFR28_11078 [Arenicella xantha]